MIGYQVSVTDLFSTSLHYILHHVLRKKTSALNLAQCAASSEPAQLENWTINTGQQKGRRLAASRPATNQQQFMLNVKRQAACLPANNQAPKRFCYCYLLLLPEAKLLLMMLLTTFTSMHLECKVTRDPNRRTFVFQKLWFSIFCANVLIQALPRPLSPHLDPCVQVEPCHHHMVFRPVANLLLRTKQPDLAQEPGTCQDQRSGNCANQNLWGNPKAV